MVPDIIVVL